MRKPALIAVSCSQLPLPYPERRDDSIFVRPVTLFSIVSEAVGASKQCERMRKGPLGIFARLPPQLPS